MPAGLEVLEHRTLYHDPRFHAAFPSIVRLPDHTLLLAFRRGRDPRYFLHTQEESRAWMSHVDPRSHLVTLHLDGTTLEPAGPPAVIPPDPEAAEQDASLHVLEDGRVALASFAWYPFPSSAGPLFVPGMASGLDAHGRARVQLTTFFVWGAFVRFSEDGGRSFGAHHYLPAVPSHDDPWAQKRPVYRGGVRGALVESQNTLLVAGYGGVRDRSPAELFAIDLRTSEPVHRAQIARAEEAGIHLQEPALLQARDGSLVAYCRSAGLEDRVVIARSTDGGEGAHWAPWRATELRGHPVHPLRLSDGSVLLTYGFRHEPFGIRARLLDDETEVDLAPEITLRDDGPDEDLGYPWAVELADGRILVVYYWQKDGARVIECTTIMRKSTHQ